MTNDLDSDRPQSTAARSALLVLLILLVLTWAMVTPYLVFGAAITSAPFFGEQPSAAELAGAARLMREAGGCALLIPLAGLTVACLGSRTKWAVAFATMTAVGAIVAVPLFIAGDLGSPGSHG